MKRFLFTVIFMTIAFAASAQYAVHPTTIDIKGSRVFVDGEKLSDGLLCLYGRDRPQQ